MQDFSYFILFYLNHHFYFPALRTRRRFYPQRSSGQAVVTGVVPSPPRYVPSCLSRIGLSIPTARRFSPNECCQLTLSRFPLINFSSRKIPHE